MTIMKYFGLLRKVKVAMFRMIEGFLLSDNFDVWFPHLCMIFILVLMMKCEKVYTEFLFYS